jgi:hypothetical protein
MPNREEEGSHISSSVSPPRSTMFGKAWGQTKWIAKGPIRAFPKDEIVENGRLIGTLVEKVRRRPRQGGPFRVYEDRTFDLAATAFLHGIAVGELEELLWRRQRESARAAYLSFGLGWLSFLAWLVRAATTPWTSGHLLPVIEYAPFCVIFFLVAFRCALQNYQIRTRRLATASEYLQTPDSFWPR